MGKPRHGAVGLLSTWQDPDLTGDGLTPEFTSKTPEKGMFSEDRAASSSHHPFILFKCPQLFHTRPSVRRWSLAEGHPDGPGLGRAPSIRKQQEKQVRWQENSEGLHHFRLGQGKAFIALGLALIWAQGDRGHFSLGRGGVVRGEVPPGDPTSTESLRRIGPALRATAALPPY